MVAGWESNADAVAASSTWTSSIHALVPGAGLVVPVVTCTRWLPAVAVHDTVIRVNAPVVADSAPRVVPSIRNRTAGLDAGTHTYADAVYVRPMVSPHTL